MFSFQDIGIEKYISAGETTGYQVSVGSGAMAVTPEPRATLVALDILRNGGTAVDAAIAASSVLMVVTPHQCSPGGDSYWLIKPFNEQIQALNSSGRSPRSIDARQLEQYSGRIPARSAHAVTVPGVIEGWIETHHRFGTMSLRKLLNPAINLARYGFPVSPYLARKLKAADDLLAGREETSRIFRPNNRPIKVGEFLVQRDLADTLQRLAQDPKDFYRGQIASEMAQYFDEIGGWLANTDFENHKSNWTKPINAKYGNWFIEEMPPNSQGIIALIGLMIYLDVANRLELDSDLVRTHAQIEAARIAMTVRNHEIGDMRAMRYQPGELVSPDFIEHLAGKVNLGKALSKKQILESLDYSKSTNISKHPRGDTVHCAIVDQKGMAVSMIQSIYFDFGTGIIIPGTGIILQNRGHGFVLQKRHVNNFEVDKRPLHTLSPAMALDNEHNLIAVFGAMGGDAQPQLHMQMVDGLFDHALDPATVAYRPRWYVNPNDGLAVLVESRMKLAEKLEDLGHRIRKVSPFDDNMGHEQIIMIDHRKKVKIGAADPRSDGIALSF